MKCTVLCYFFRMSIRKYTQKKKIYSWILSIKKIKLKQGKISIVVFVFSLSEKVEVSVHLLTQESQLLESHNLMTANRNMISEKAPWWFERHMDAALWGQKTNAVKVHISAGSPVSTQGHVFFRERIWAMVKKPSVSDAVGGVSSIWEAGLSVLWRP